CSISAARSTTDQPTAFTRIPPCSRPISAAVPPSRPSRRLPQKGRAMLLEVDGLEVRYDRNVAIRDVDIGVAEGQIVAVPGANGAGKRTLLRAIQGMVRAARGMIRFDGEDVTRASVPARVRNGLVLVPEGRQIFVSLTVHDNLLMGAYTRNDDRLAADIDAVY